MRMISVVVLLVLTIGGLAVELEAPDKIETGKIGDFVLKDLPKGAAVDWEITPSKGWDVRIPDKGILFVSGLSGTYELKIIVFWTDVVDWEQKILNNHLEKIRHTFQIGEGGPQPPEPSPPQPIDPIDPTIFEDLRSRVKQWTVGYSDVDKSNLVEAYQSALAKIADYKDISKALSVLEEELKKVRVARVWSDFFNLLDNYTLNNNLLQSMEGLKDTIQAIASGLKDSLHPDGPAPMPGVDKLHVLIINETADLHSYSEAQSAVMYGGRVAQYMRDNKIQFRVYDKDVTLPEDVSEPWQSALNKYGGQTLPCVVISNAKRGYVGPIPTGNSVDEVLDKFIDLVDSYKEN